MADNVQVGDKVSWNWNGNQPSGTVGEVKAGEVTVTSHRGNEISKTGDEENPAVHIERSGNDVVKKASELKIDEKGTGSSEAEKQENVRIQSKDANEKEKDKNEAGEKPSENNEKEDEAVVGEKRKADEKVDANEKEAPMGSGEAAKDDEKAKKKQKIANSAANGTADGTTNGTANKGANENKKAPGRPKSNGEKKIAPKKEKKVPAVGRSERKTRSQGAA